MSNLFTHVHVADRLELTVEVSRLDLAVADGFASEVSALLGSRVRRLTVAVGKVDFVDSSGLGALVKLRKQLGADGALEIRDATPHIRRILQLTKLEGYFDVASSA